MPRSKLVIVTASLQAAKDVIEKQLRISKEAMVVLMLLYL